MESRREVHGMGTRSLVGLMGLLAVGGGLVAQQPQPQPKTEGTRDLFYFGATQKDTLPPIRKASTAVRAKSTPAPAPTLSAGTEADRAPGTPGDAGDAASVAHPGFRDTVDPDRDFRKGECVRLEVESNHSGYLYVLSKQSSGGWLPLFPSSEMPDESNVGGPGQKARAPKDYCFES